MALIWFNTFSVKRNKPKNQLQDFNVILIEKKKLNKNLSIKKKCNRALKEIKKNCLRKSKKMKLFVASIFLTFLVAANAKPTKKVSF